jgi:hypothetical protein
VSGGIHVDYATMKMKIMFWLEKTPKTCCACCVDARNVLESFASNVERELHGITVASASCGTMTRTKVYIIVMTVVYAEKAVVWEKISSTARLVTFIRSWHLEFSLINEVDLRCLHVYVG